MNWKEVFNFAANTTLTGFRLLVVGGIAGGLIYGGISVVNYVAPAIDKTLYPERAAPLPQEPVLQP